MNIIDFFCKSPPHLQPFSAQGTPPTWSSLPSGGPLFQVLAQSSFECLKKIAATVIPFGKGFHKSSICCMKKYLLLFWKRLLNFCLTVTTSCIGRDCEQLTPNHPLHITLDFIDLNQRNPHSGLCLSLSLLSQKLTITCVLAAFFQGIREFTKMFLLPRVPAHPCGKTSALTHWLDIEHAEHNSHTKLGVRHWSQIFNCQSVSAELFSSWHSTKYQRFCFTWYVKLGILRLRSPHYFGTLSSF